MLSFNQSSLMMSSSKSLLGASPDDQNLSRSDLFQSGSFMFQSSLSLLRINFGDDEEHHTSSSHQREQSQKQQEEEDHKNDLSLANMPEEAAPAFDISSLDIAEDSVDDFMVSMMAKSVQQMSISSWGHADEEELEELPPMEPTVTKFPSTTNRPPEWKKTFKTRKSDSLQDIVLEDFASNLIGQEQNESPRTVAECLSPTPILEENKNHVPIYEEKGRCASNHQYAEFPRAEHFLSNMGPPLSGQQGGLLEPNPPLGYDHTAGYNARERWYPSQQDGALTVLPPSAMTPPRANLGSTTPPRGNLTSQHRQTSSTTSFSLEEQLEIASQRLARSMQQSMQSRHAVKEQGGIVLPGAARPSW